MMRTSIGLAVLCAGLAGQAALADEPVYGGFPVTVKGYAGDESDSTSYSGQAARHVLHTSLKKLAGQGSGEADDELQSRMMAYFSGEGPGRQILDPATNGVFVVAQTRVDEISKGKNLSGKAYGGAPTTSHIPRARHTPARSMSGTRHSATSARRRTCCPSRRSRPTASPRPMRP